MKIRNATIEDLSELIVIENLCFVKEEAATRAAFEKRLTIIPDSFFVAEEGGKIVGLVNGPVIPSAYITDALFRDIQANPVSGGHQSILGLAVDPRFQKLGIAATLLAHMEKAATLQRRETVTLTCKEKYIRFYESHGYSNRGISGSQLGGVAWFNMIKKLQ